VLANNKETGRGGIITKRDARRIILPKEKKRRISQTSPASHPVPLSKVANSFIETATLQRASATQITKMPVRLVPAFQPRLFPDAAYHSAWWANLTAQAPEALSFKLFTDKTVECSETVSIWPWIQEHCHGRG
jgi:hypothetical protein